MIHLALMLLNSLIFLCFGSVLTPYYSEETVYSRADLESENEDGVSIIFYLRKIFPGLWQTNRYNYYFLKIY